MTQTDFAISERPTGQAVLRGLKRRCPNCGQGHMFNGYLTVADSCDHCGEDLSHQKADDGPAWLTMIIVGHLMAPLLHIYFVHFRPEPLVLFGVFAVGCTALALALLPRLKGLIVGFQWARRMHGFGHNG